MNAAAGRRRPGAAGSLLLLLVLSSLGAPLMASPAAAVGTTVDVYMHPPRSVGTPSKDGPGAVNLTAETNVFGSSTSGTLVYTVTSDQGWEARPATGMESVPAGGGQFVFDFQILVPPDAPAGVTSGIQILAEYRVGPATVASGIAGVSVEAGKYYAASVRRISAEGPMSPGTVYIIEYDVVNQGNAGAVMEFHWTDPDQISRLKADFIAPGPLSVPPLDNRTAEFRITPQGTTPAGKYEVPAQMVVTDRTGEHYDVVNFTIRMEFDNLPIYPGILPRIDLRGVQTVLGWVGVFLAFWLAFNAAIAFVRRKDYDEEDGMPFFQAYSERLSNTLLYRGVRRAARRGGRKGRRKAPRSGDASRRSVR